MSFIRSLNNPEAMYVFDHVGGFISMSWKGHDPICLSRRDFYGLCRTGTRFGSLMIKEVHVDHISGKILTKKEEKRHEANTDKWLRAFHPRHVNFKDYTKGRKLTKVQLAYNKVCNERFKRWLPDYKIALYQNGKLITTMWGVTWSYIVNQGQRRLQCR